MFQWKLISVLFEILEDNLQEMWWLLDLAFMLMS